MKSQNQWPVIDQASGTRLWIIPVTAGPRRAYRLHPGHAGFVLCHVILWFHESIEKINEGIWDEWGWSVRSVSGSTTTVSNHASGTAADVNATKHPLGVAHTFTKAGQYAKIRARLFFYAGVIRAGTQYHNRKDEMHWEINVTPESGRVRKLAARLAGTPRGKRIIAANPGYRPAVVYAPGDRPLYRGNAGPDVVFVQRRVGADVDGDYGPKTEEKVRVWKRANAVRQPGMTPDGHVGKITWQALGVKVKYR